MNVKISVAMATCNGEQFLLAQLKSILLQTVSPVELVVCDDYSTDKTVGILERFREEAGFSVRIHKNQENLGSTKSFEKAICLCEGDIIVLADQDDIWYPEKLREIQNGFATHRSAVGCFSDADLIDVNGDKLGVGLWKSLNVDAKAREQLAKGGEKAFRLLLRRNIITGATFAFKKEYTDWFTPIPRQWIHDSWIALILSLRGNIYSINRPLIGYRQHEANQIGVRRKAPLKRATDHRAIETSIFNNQLLIERIKASNRDWAFYAKVHAEKKSRHLEKRVSFSVYRPWSILLIFAELFTGGYHSYSNGFLSFLKDLVRVR